MGQPTPKYLSFFLVFLTFTFHPGTAEAQSFARVGDPAETPASTLLQVDSAPPSPSTWKSRFVTGMVTAVLGAGVGYFASQVATSDWDESRGGSGVHRGTWAAVGGAGGFALGFSIPGLGIDSGGGGERTLGPDRFLITGVEIREASVGNALEAIQLFHPEWLVLRGQEDFYDPEGDNIRVYLDEVRMGGIDELAGIDAQGIEYIRFFDSRQATARWGTGHPHGAIQVVAMER